MIYYLLFVHFQFLRQKCPLPFACELHILKCHSAFSTCTANSATKSTPSSPYRPSSYIRPSYLIKSAQKEPKFQYDNAKTFPGSCSCSYKEMMAKGSQMKLPSLASVCKQTHAEMAKLLIYFSIAETHSCFNRTTSSSFHLRRSSAELSRSTWISISRK
jgi:hypothetical protein